MVDLSRKEAYTHLEIFVAANLDDVRVSDEMMVQEGGSSKMTTQQNVRLVEILVFS